MTYAKKTLSEIKLIHGDYGNFIKGQKLPKDKEKKYKTPPYKDLAASNEIDGEPLDEKCWPGYEKKGMKTMFGKRYPNCVKKEETVIEHHQKDKNGNTIPHEDTTPSSVEEGAAWTKKSGKNPSGGLNEKGRKSYERDNPGSDLKRPSKKVGNKRRASFCARMRGMKKKLTSAKLSLIHI